MTSRPLFISVEESTVIFGPMLQVGWARASSMVTSARSAAARPRNGPPLAVSTSCGDALRPGFVAGAEALVQGPVFAVDGDQFSPGGATGALYHRTAGDQRLLVGQRQPLAGQQRGQGDPEPGEPDDAVHADVGFLAEAGQPLGPDADLDVPQPLARRIRPGLIGNGHDSGTHGVHLRGQLVEVATGGPQGDDS
jgi:hypothetical protein